LRTAHIFVAPAWSKKIYAKTTLAQSHDDWLAELPDHLFGGQP
jgi:hypothetical protein